MIAVFKWHGKWNSVVVKPRRNDSITDLLDSLERMGFYGLDRESYVGFQKSSNAAAFMADRMAGR